jgi:uncharacterized membrane protein SpoIIM required for sporulation
MRQEAFVEKFAPLWDEFERWLLRFEGKNKKSALPAKGLSAAEIPHAYRTLCQHLALARERSYSPLLVARLSELSLRGHQHLYGARLRVGAQILNFIAGGFPQLVRREWGWVWLAAALFFGPMLVLIVSLQAYPDFAYTVLGSEQVQAMEQMYDPASRVIGKEREADSDFTMFAFYIWNNVKIGFQTFAGGVLFGLGTLFFLIYNGTVIGGAAGYLHYIGYGKTFWPFVAGHSAPELIAIVISGAAGLKLGWALIAPGQLPRGRALAAVAQPAVRLMLGAAALFVFAAVIEGFWSPRTFVPIEYKIGLGIGLWLVILAYLVFAGRGGH